MSPAPWKETLMADTTITVTLDQATAEAYSLATPSDQAKMQLLFRLLLREYTSASSLPLSQVMDRISEEAEQRGLTPAILEQLLRDDE
jgi:hypothetical protein